MDVYITKFCRDIKWYRQNLRINDSNTDDNDDHDAVDS